MLEVCLDKRELIILHHTSQSDQSDLPHWLEGKVISSLPTVLRWLCQLQSRSLKRPNLVWISLGLGTLISSLKWSSLHQAFPFSWIYDEHKVERRSVGRSACFLFPTISTFDCSSSSEHFDESLPQSSPGSPGSPSSPGPLKYEEPEQSLPFVIRTQASRSGVMTAKQ